MIKWLDEEDLQIIKEIEERLNRQLAELEKMAGALEEEKENLTDKIWRQ